MKSPLPTFLLLALFWTQGIGLTVPKIDGNEVFFVNCHEVVQVELGPNGTFHLTPTLFAPDLKWEQNAYLDIEWVDCFDIGKPLIVTLAVRGKGTKPHQCKILENAIDADAPTAICQKALTVPLSPTGSFDLSTPMIASASYDNCGPIFHYFIEGKTHYTCEDAGEQFSVTVQVEDIHGNTNQCGSFISVVDPYGFCRDHTLANF
jgi:hypothetical protein